MKKWICTDFCSNFWFTQIFLNTIFVFLLQKPTTFNMHRIHRLLPFINFFQDQALSRIFFIMETLWKSQIFSSWPSFPIFLWRIWKWGQAFCYDLPAVYYFMKLTHFADVVHVPAVLGIWCKRQMGVGVHVGWFLQFFPLEVIFLMWAHSFCSQGPMSCGGLRVGAQRSACHYWQKPSCN